MIAKKIWLVLTVVLANGLIGCGVNKAIIANTTNGPKELFVTVQNDPLFASLEIKIILESKGYDVALSSEAGEKAVVENTTYGAIIHKNVSESSNRYGLMLSYRAQDERILEIAASVRDRDKNKLLGTYRWKWDKLFPAPKIEGAIDLIEENLLSKNFQQLNGPGSN